MTDEFDFTYDEVPPQCGHERFWQCYHCGACAKCDGCDCPDE